MTPPPHTVRHLPRRDARRLLRLVETHAAITGPGIDLFLRWIDNETPVGRRPTPLTTRLCFAATGDTTAGLADLASDSNHWVRLAVANNPTTPVSVLWGDGISSFGLAGDSNMWVSGTVLLRMSSPPVEVCEAVARAAALQ